MAVTAQIKGIDRLRTRLMRMQSNITNQTQREMVGIITDMDRDVKETIQRGSRTGRIYGKHQASAPGEPPKSDTGILASSFLFYTKATKRQVIGTIENIAEYAKYLEFKPKSSGGRPFMRPLYNRWRNEASKRLRLTIKTSIKRASRG